jgi:hypothetical protein
MRAQDGIGEFQIQTAEIVLELRWLPRSNDGDYRHRLLAQPRECDVRHATTGLFRDCLHRIVTRLCLPPAAKRAVELNETLILVAARLR